MNLRRGVPIDRLGDGETGKACVGSGSGGRVGGRGGVGGRGVEGRRGGGLFSGRFGWPAIANVATPTVKADRRTYAGRQGKLVQSTEDIGGAGPRHLERLGQRG